MQPRGDGLWTTDDASFRVLGVAPIGARMTIARLLDGRVVLISPIPLSPELRDEIDRIGPVTSVIAPNLVHHLFAADAKKTFPDAKLLAAPGLAEKRPRIPFDGLVTDPSSNDWRGELEPLATEGFPFLNEVVFFHRPTRTLILTDLCFNIRRAPWFAIPVFQLNDMWRHFGPSRIFRLLIRDRRALRATFDQVLRWDFERVIVAHGDVLERGGPQALREAYAFL